MKITGLLCGVLLLISAAGCQTAEEDTKFQSFFAWGLPQDEAGFQYAVECGVTDGIVSNAKQRQLAQRCKIRRYVIYKPAGEKLQQLLPEEEKLLKLYSTAGGLTVPSPGAGSEEKRHYQLQRSKFYREMHYRHGGEPERQEVLRLRLPCLAHPENIAAARAALNEICRKPDLDGVAFDYAGFTNYHGCYCNYCQMRYREFLAAKHLPDTPENRNAFSLETLIKYNNTLIEFIRQQRPDFKIAAHLYPVFLPEILYGKYLNFDICAETAAWYFLWPEEKIAGYTRKIVNDNPHGVPFAGYYDADKPGSASFDRKTPERLDRELEIIRQNGGRNLMICSPVDLFYREEFRKVLKKHIRNHFADGEKSGF